MPKATAGLDQETEYEKTRRENMESNQKLLEELMGKQMDLPAGLAAGFAVLGIDEPKPKTKAKPKPKPKKAPKPAKVKKEKDGEEEEKEEREGKGTRRSARQASKPSVSYAKDGEKIVDRSKMPKMVSRPDKNWDSDDSDEGEGEDGEGKVRVNKLVGRVHDPKTFGLIPGVPIGAWWETRAECSAAAIHAPFVAGISGGPEGAYSVALSGGYDDDVDMGDAFTYTGSGGRDLKGTAKNPKNLRTAPQSSHQSFEHSFNKALKVSSETRKPVRVIRGYKLPGVFAPESGYRYDGLYIVERAWMERGNNPKGWKVCKYAFRRIPGQPPIPRKGENAKAAQSDVEMEDAEESDEDEEEKSGEDEEEEGEGEDGEKTEEDGEEEGQEEAEDEADTKEEEEAEEAPAEKPKRGRPKSKAKAEPKSKAKAKAKGEPEEEAEEEDELEEEEEKPAPAKRGRKPKAQVKEQPAEKPKRGRPRKSKVEEEEPMKEESGEEEAETEAEPAPAKRGRKPGPKSKAQSGSEESAPVSKRGRKPKVKSEPDEEEEGEGEEPAAKKSKVEEAPKRKRGRPPKSKPQ